MKKVKLVYLKKAHIRSMNLLLTASAILFATNFVHAKEIKTNAVVMSDAPIWLGSPRVERVTERIQNKMEWTIRRINVFWYADQAAFEKVHGFGSSVSAFARKSDNSVHIGPHVNEANFDGIFGHELVHIISYQKFKDAIPAWLEEGLANYLSKNAKADYAWLNKQPAVTDVRNLTHPFNGSEDNARFHYVASLALAEMISSKCDLLGLLRLSVERKLDNYLGTYCEIKDLTGDFYKWLKLKSRKK